MLLVAFVARSFVIGWELDNLPNGDPIEASETIHGNLMDPTVTTTYAKDGGRCLVVPVYSTYSAYAVADVKPSLTEWWLRMAFMLGTATTGSVNFPILAWATSQNAEIGSLRLDFTSRLLSVWSASASLATAATGALRTNRWHVIEVHWKAATSGGIAQVKVNGTQVINFSGNTGSANQTGQVWFGGLRKVSGSWPTASLYYDDCALDDAGWCGDGHVACLLPNGNGNTTQLTGSDGNQVNNYALVNTPPTTMTTYARSTTSGEKDTYAATSAAEAGIPPNASIGQLDVLVAGRSDFKTDAGFAGVVRTGGSDYSGTAKRIDAELCLRTFGFATNPNTGLAWTQSDLDALEIGASSQTV